MVFHFGGLSGRFFCAFWTAADDGAFGEGIVGVDLGGM